MSKYKIPTLLENMGTLIDIYNETIYILQVYVPCGYEPEKVAKLINDQTHIVCYCRNFIGLDADYANRVAKYVYINATSAIAHRLPEIRKQIREVLQAEYGLDKSVDNFLRAIGAGSELHKFAYKCDSMWELWNAAIDYKKWHHLYFVISKILAPPTANKTYDWCNFAFVDELKHIHDFLSPWDAERLGSVFTAEYLKSINPFERSEVEE